MHGKKTVIIGIDGVPYGLIEDLSNRGIMPNFKDLRKDGVFTRMEAPIPEISSVSWSSIITGKNAGEHGIYGFTDLIDKTYVMSFPSFSNLKAKTFWQKNKNKKYVIINVPSTYPVQEINGFLVSGFVSLDLEKAVYPKSYVQTLKQMNYQIDVDAKKAYKSKRLFLEDLFKTHEKRVELYRYLWDRINWNEFMIVFTGSDRLEHFLLDAYEDIHHEHHPQFLEYFKKVDDAIGEINGKLKEDDSLIILSDHGMELIKTNININAILEENGFLKLGDNPSKRYNNIKEGTKAFALDPSRIYLNRKDMYPKGIIKKEGEEDILDDLIELFSNLEANGEKIIRKVCKRDQIYHGKYKKYAPDLVLLSNSGYNLRGSIEKKEMFEKNDIIVGMHTQQDAFLFVKKRENKDVVPEKPNVENVQAIHEGIV